MNRKGFTIYEVIMALLIIAIFTSMAMANFSNMIRNYTLDVAVSELRGELSMARITAMRTNRQIDVSCTSTVCMFGSRPYTLHKGLTVVSPSFSFYTDGRSDPSLSPLQVRTNDGRTRNLFVSASGFVTTD